jgi:ATP-dependent Clp protease adaptor protein ClpS
MRTAGHPRVYCGLRIVFFLFFVYVYQERLNMAAVFGNDTQLADKSREKLKEPEQFRVILLNDHYTTMEFVVDVLISIFHKNEEDANRIMLDVHRRGQGMVGMYPFDIAQTKANQVHAAAREREFPLRCIVEQA